ncbi:Dam family site-specific DNA-(adenine-N6)-methyltransferase [Larkinella terrae]|uniref:Site-specific DNA-methyltransferase (adenine-specific) n=1 Tax=Larkinella terrae TaxID=2025311 RepID=A0A7K0ENQ5_9BACT|nr:Dam family site-specific DNA-(adenine-N6)-methyltransferase [Larkinella terrae]MRS63098.1 Dam family site-specific DNA-(adenine-N6)-methyltransferase [Larkinella terrae]
MGLIAAELIQVQAKPVLKWAGGKMQIINQLMERSPKKFNKYIEPFFGGGALFFHLNPTKAIIADSNPELTNLYQCLATNPYKLIELLTTFRNEEDLFYSTRALEFNSLDPYHAAARTLYLNRTCFNGLYRVNKKGQFNVPYGRYANPKIGDPDVLLAASEVLQRAIIYNDDYKAVLREHAEPGDFVFLDPPYLPISKYSDFKRYTKEQFYEEDHKELAEEVHRLHELGCYVLLSNSNHPLVHELYGAYKIEVLQTKRNINSKAGGRTGEDVIVTVPFKRSITQVLDTVPEQVDKFPSTRWMGSKSKLLPHLTEVTRRFEFESAMDLFSGSGIVGYMFKTLGKRVISNDYMSLAATYSKAMIENSSVKLSEEKARALLKPGKKIDTFVQDTFAGLYFTAEENLLIDVLRSNIKKMSNQYERAIALSALVRACTKKRPRGIFTYVGQRYDDGRKDLQISLEDHFLNAVKDINNAVFDNGQVNASRRGDAMSIRKDADLVYMDPPYFSPLSDNEYVRRYHFIEGLACDWEGLEIQQHTKTKKFKSYPTPFSSRKGAFDAFDKLFHRFKDSILVVSYSSNSLPTLDEMVGLMSKYKEKVEVVKVDYKYSFGNQKEGVVGNDAQEYIFIGY